MSRIFSARLSETWLKAAVVGSLWASFEIIIGSFLHNLRMPFAGTLLSFASVGLVIAFLQVWNMRGLVWRAGLIAALLKSLSPSAIILGPMIGIFSEALIIEFFILVFGRNLAGYIIGGAIAVLSALFHKIATLLVTYGFDLIIIVDQLYKYIIKQLGMTEGDPQLLIGIIMLAYMALGVLGAMLGYLGGRKALTLKTGKSIISPDRQSSFFSKGNEQKTSPWFLLYHLFCIVSCLYMLNTVPLWISFLPAVIYAVFCLYWYRVGMRSFRRLSFWIWFMAITILAAFFWNGISTGELWNMEGLLVGLKMNLRAIVILTGFAAISRELRNPIIRTVLYHHGFANVYHAVGLAFSVLPGVIKSLPGVKTLISRPVSTLGMIIREASLVYPALEDELAGQPPVIIITGNVQEGKTSFLLQVVDALKKDEIKINGFLARGVHEDDQRIGYDLEDISSGESLVYIRNTPSAGWYRHGKYYFSPEGESFGRQILKDAEVENTELMIIDEIGPVELKGRGWADEIEALVNTGGMMQLWVVRRPLLKNVIRQWSIGDVLVLDVTEDEPDKSAEEVISFIKSKRINYNLINL